MPGRVPTAAQTQQLKSLFKECASQFIEYLKAQRTERPNLDSLLGFLVLEYDPSGGKWTKVNRDWTHTDRPGFIMSWYFANTQVQHEVGDPPTISFQQPGIFDNDHLGTVATNIDKETINFGTPIIATEADIQAEAFVAESSREPDYNRLKTFTFKVRFTMTVPPSFWTTP